jgi:predicted  nucleic acid-binding Zn-ribbon protein
MQQMDSLKPAIEAWKGVDAEVRSVATGNGLNLDTPEAYKKDLEAVYDAMQFDGSGNSNESNFSRDVSALMLDSEVADIEGAKGEASGARSDLESAEQVLKAAQARLDAFKAEEGKEGAEKELAAVKAKAKMIADIIGVVTKLATGVNAFNDLRVEKDAAKKASGQRKEGLALPGSLGGFLEAGVKAVVFGRQIDALSGRITAAQSQITSLNAAGLQADISGASASATAAATKMKAFDAKAKALQERYQARMEKIGRKFDRREVDDSTPKGKKQLEEQKGPMKASGASVSIEAVMSVYGGLQRRGAARETALAVLQQCPQIGNADAILERAMRLDGGNKYGRTDPLRTRTDEQLPSDLKPEWYTKQYNERVARQTQDSAALVSSVGFVQLVVAELEQDAGADAACEQGWAALVTTAMSGKK